ncbi:MAG: GGDEF domain-containing protein [Oscillospiraceae bacterium]|nr:GGDEF domain-containing protein [Oscillospiraceae bacterium]
MAILLDFLVQNYVLLIMLTGMYLLTSFDVYLDRFKIFKLRCTLLMLLGLVIFDHIELRLRLLDHFTLWRVLFSALCYSLRPAIVMMLVFLTRKSISRMFCIPAALNMLIAFSAFFTDISYGFSERNEFYRGALGMTPYVVTAFYVLMLYIVSIRGLARGSGEEEGVVLFLAVAASVAMLIAAYDHDEIINLLFTAELLLYYLYVYAQFTKRDQLTGLFNRQSFFGDLEKSRGTVSGIISIDMNELKWLNDTFGHAAGDKALSAIAEQLGCSAGARDRLYRIGGDEFIMICRGHSHEEMQALIESMRQNVTQAGYSCAFGLSGEGTVEEMIRQADFRMYADKARIKAENAAQNGPLHLR